MRARLEQQSEHMTHATGNNASDLSYVHTHPDGGLVRPEALLLTEPADEVLPDGIPEEERETSEEKLNAEATTDGDKRSTAVASPLGCPSPDLWGRREEAEGMVDTAGELLFFTARGLYWRHTGA